MTKFLQTLKKLWETDDMEDLLDILETILEAVSIVLGLWFWGGVIIMVFIRTFLEDDDEPSVSELIEEMQKEEE